MSTELFTDPRQGILRRVYQAQPFDLRGGWRDSCLEVKPGCFSCLMIASQRVEEIDLLLNSFQRQTISKKNFEIVILNDLYPELIRPLVKKYERTLTIKYVELTEKATHLLSNLRNYTLDASCGEFILFLDDDTRIDQDDFLEKLLGLFQRYSADVVIPRALPAFGLVKERYDHLDPYAMVTRCSAYRRKVLREVGGFLRDLTAYEDIELSIRVRIKNYSVYKTSDIHYYHPPHFFHSLQKPLAIGRSIFQLRNHYSFFLWVVLYFNTLRFLIYGFVPNKRLRQWFQISLGVLLFPFSRKSYYY